MSSRPASARSASAKSASPALPLLHASLLLAGLGTVLLGPILPLLAHRWGLVDAQSGLLMAAKFCGAFLGGVTVSRRLRFSLLAGLAAAAIGFGWFALAPGIGQGSLGLALGGFGLGRMITATNILAGQRYQVHRGSALALLNFSFSAGAMLSALGAAWLLPRFALRPVLEGFAALFALVGLWMFLDGRGGRADEAGPVDGAEAAAGQEFPDQQSPGQQSPSQEPNTFGFRSFAVFALLLFFYGGLETCLSGWLTTFALRYGDRSFALSAYTTLLFWGALTGGRIVSSAVMLRWSERGLQRAGLVASAGCVAALAAAHGALAIAILAVLLGLSLSPFFPATFALLMAERPSASQAAMVIAASGLGAASLPWLMGVVSTGVGSLQVALALPFGAALALLVLSLVAKNGPSHGRKAAPRTASAKA